ncbi:kinesin-like protein KIF3B isoform X2 [Periplaneta americana]|uniref:kinesin-like protein KIF3B isoform X2 n=1 Tax=Periplaneta americana TaxID=6978 RepID=UPI0037E86399
MDKSDKYLPTRRVPNNEAVQVVVRCRPMNEKELAAGHSCVVDCFPSRGAIEITNPNIKDVTAREGKKLFTYDAVYDWNSRQEDIYDETVRPLVASVLDGFNGTIFAYGQTGTGKTYTMEGAQKDPTQKGIIPKSFEQIFSHISRSSNVQYLVRTSYLEIYQEDIRDLLNKDQTKKYELREKTDIGVYVKDLSSFVCKSIKEIEQVMNIGNQNRKIGATNMNEHSSRSHTIFMITIEMSGIGGKMGIRVGKLNLVDLAGSERQSKTGATGERLKEASKINLSLSALGNVISALVLSSGKPLHIPYRDSKLTRILQDSLGGNSKTIMVANIGPASYNYDESLTTLRYANRAKNIKNKPRVNEDPKDALLREYQIEIARLKTLLAERLKQREALELQRLKVAQHKKKHEESDDSNDEQQDNKKEKSHKTKVTPEEKQRLHEELEEKKRELAHEKLVTARLEAKIEAMESKLLCGGKNIIDHTNEQQRALELRTQEIAEKKKLEVEIRQQLEMQEESALEIMETYTTLQQEVEIKTKKLKKLFTKLQCVKQEIHDLTDEFNQDRRQLEQTQNDIMKELKVKYLIIENFIPTDEKNRLLSRTHYDEENDTWVIAPYEEEETPNIPKRPVSADDERRPVSDYSRVAMKVGRHPRYHSENVLNIELDPHMRTTSDYQGPLVAPKIQAVLEEALRDDGVIDVDAAPLSISSTAKSRTARKEKDKDKHSKTSKTRGKRIVSQCGSSSSHSSQPSPVFPKARGLVPK